MVFLKTSLLLIGVFLSPIKALVPVIEEENLSTHRPVLPIGIEGSMEKFFEYARSGSPLIQEYLQNGINVFYKPTFILDPTLHKQPLTVENEDCVKPLGPSYPEGIDEPVRILETIDNNVDGKVRHIIDIIPGSKAILPLPAANPVLVEEPMVVQELPILPPQLEPELAAKEVIIETSKISETAFPEKPEAVSFIIEEPVLISEAPVLPPLILPEIQLPTITLPAKVGGPVKTTNVPEPPFLPPMPESLPVIVEEPVMIPEGPVLPPLVLPEFPIPTMIKPVEDEVVVESLDVSEPLPLPSIPESVPVLIEEPVMIPESPLSPSLILPEIPTPSLIEPAKVEVTVETLNTEPPMPELIPVLVEEPVMMPESPVLLPEILSEIPAPITIEPAQTKVLIETMNVSEPPLLLPESVSIIPEELPLEISLPIETELPTLPEESLSSKVAPEFIPDAPIFPSLNIPEIPTIVDIIPPPIPELPTMPLPVPSATLLEPLLAELDGPIPMPVEAIPAIMEEPMFIPEAPILPPLEMPELPEPVLIKEQVTVNSEKPDSNRQAVIPPLPMLPPFQVPPFPLLVPSSQSPCPESTSMPVPSPAGFPVFVLPNMPNMPVPYQTALPMIPLVPAFSANVPITQEMIEQDKMSMSSLPLTILFPKSCVQEIVVERVLPNIACEKMMVPTSNPVSTVGMV